MDRKVKIVVASCVVLVAIALAMMFRREPPHPEPSASGPGDRLVLRKQSATGNGQSKGHDDGLEPSAATSGGRKPTVPSPVDSASPPPALADDYPGRNEAGPTRWDTSIGIGPPRAAQTEDSARTHKIVDGDSLVSLARRYLGSADRHLEIYEANRGVLRNPGILPIGAELKIPLRVTSKAPSPAAPDRRPLVPIPRR